VTIQHPVVKHDVGLTNHGHEVVNGLMTTQHPVVKHDVGLTNHGHEVVNGIVTIQHTIVKHDVRLTYHGHEVVDGLDPLWVGQQVHDQIPQVSAEHREARSVL
jgi:hypothetical protein